MSSFAKTLIAVSLIIINRQEKHDSLINRQNFNDEYDYIIVGAGTAGAVVASRLAEHEDLKILVIEAGSSETVTSDMPAMTKSLYGSDMDWNFKMSSQKMSFKGYNGNYGYLNQGKVMGGSSTINALAYVRGLKLDFDNWKSFGVDGWSWDEVMQYFIKSENNTDPTLNKTYHGFNGYMTVTTPQEPRLIHKTMVRAAKELGYNEIDLNDPNKPIGAAIQQMAIRYGSRCSTATTFLQPMVNKTNLHIMANTLVTKINFDANKKAVSVNVLKSDQQLTINVRKELILSAGAINTPKLLMLSGIGPKDHLIEHNIPVIADLPVGNNFHDNPITFGVHFTTNATKESLEILQKDVSDFFLKGSGRLTQFDKSVLRLKTSTESNNLWPDMQIFVGIGSLADFTDSESVSKILNLKPEVWDQFYKPYSQQSTLTFIPLLNRPQSRGTIRLRSNKYSDEPLVDPNYFDNINDVKSMVEGMKMGYSLGQTKSFTDTYDTKPFTTRVPNCQTLWSESLPLSQNNEYLECVAKTLTNTYSHSAGSCRMGSISDNKSVVSSELKVHNISGLRVIDASIVPQSPSGALYAAVVMIGERGAQFILSDHNIMSNSQSVNSCYNLFVNYSKQLFLSVLLILIIFLKK